jgi:hypothetical protein
LLPLRGWTAATATALAVLFGVLLVREADLQGDKLLEEARAQEAKLKAEILALKRTRRQLVEGLRVTLEMYQRLLAEEFGDAKP